MKICVPAAAAGLSLFASSAMADTIVTFGAEANQVYINNYFNGGTDSRGASGTNFGVQFGANAESLKAGTTGAGGTGTGKYENLPITAPGVLFFAPAPLTNTAPAAAADIVNVVGGFSSVAFDYSLAGNSSSNASTVQIWSGYNGTGTLVGTITLSASGTPIACNNRADSFCSWSSASLGGLGNAESIIVSGAAAGGLTEFDKLDLGTPVPLPAALWLLVSGFGGLAAFVRRRKPAAV
jgi:hypothetical protein